MKKLSSIKRIYSAFKGIDLGKIAQIQSFYANGNISELKRILNKPNIQDSTAKAYGRLANQYIAIISKPSNQEIKVAKQKYNVTLSQDYYYNLNQMNNNIVFAKPKTTKDIMNVSKTAKITKKEYEYRSEFSIHNDNDIDNFINNINLNKKERQDIINKGFTKYQVLATLELYSTREIIVSTKILNIPDIQTIINFIYKYTGLKLGLSSLFVPQTSYQKSYTIDLDEIEEIKRIKSITVRWYK